MQSLSNRTDEQIIAHYREVVWMAEVINTFKDSTT
jgi:hypothetical protein